MMYAGNQVVAQGIVEDLAAGQAAARVVKTLTETVQLEQGARVQFGEQAVFGAGISMTDEAPTGPTSVGPAGMMIW